MDDTQELQIEIEHMTFRSKTGRQLTRLTIQ